MEVQVAWASEGDAALLAVRGDWSGADSRDVTLFQRNIILFNY